MQNTLKLTSVIKYKDWFVLVKNVYGNIQSRKVRLGRVGLMRDF